MRGFCPEESRQHAQTATESGRAGSGLGEHGLDLDSNAGLFVSIN